MVTGILEYELTHSYLPSSFGMTERYFVFLEQPMYINLSSFIKNQLCGNPLAKGFFTYDYSEKVNLRPCLVLLN